MVKRGRPQHKTREEWGKCLMNSGQRRGKKKNSKMGKMAVEAERAGI